jgi:3-deoxy-7-phosphoheptulonate synthase
MQLAEMYAKRALVNPAIIVDTNHANSNKQFQEQPRIAMEVVHSMRRSPTLKKLVKGLMIESYLAEGSQSVTGKVYGKSITDPCLGWEESKKLVLRLAEYI